MIKISSFRDLYEKYWCPISPDIEPPPKNSAIVNIFENLVSGWRYYFIIISILSITLISSSRTYFVSFGLLLIVSLSIHWLWGWAELPFLGTSLPLMAGGFVVSSITTRLIYLLAGFSGVELLTWGGVGWVENSEINSVLADEWLIRAPLTCIGLIILSLLIAFFVGGFSGWLITSLGLKSGIAFVAIISYVLEDAGSWFALHIIELSGGYTGVYVPDLFVFAGENGLLALSVIMVFIVFVGLLGYNRLRGSSFGLDVKTKRDTSTLNRAIFLGCGLIGVAGCLLSFYLGFVVQANFYGSIWGSWPLLVFLVAGPDGGLGLVLGVCLLMILEHLISWNRLFLSSYFFFPVAYAFQIETAIVILIACFYYLKRAQTKKQDPLKEATA